MSQPIEVILRIVEEDAARIRRIQDEACRQTEQIRRMVDHVVGSRPVPVTIEPFAMPCIPPLVSIAALDERVERIEQLLLLLLPPARPDEDTDTRLPTGLYL
jgi:hypothetical protein